MMMILSSCLLSSSLLLLALFIFSSTNIALIAATSSPSATHPMIAFSTIRSSSATKRIIIDNTILHSRASLDFRRTVRASNQSFSAMSMSSSASDDITLSQQLATRLIHGNNPSSQEPPPPIKTCIAIAGGGSSTSSAIAATSGASSILLESVVTYDRRSFAEFVTNNLNDDVMLNSNHDGSNNNNDSSSSGSSTSSKFSFCSTQAATLLSQSALSRSIQLSPKFQDKALYCIGVGCASALVGNTEHIRGRTSKAYIALSTLRMGTKVWEVRLENGDIPSGSKRSRGEEEVVLSNLVLASMIQYREELGEEECGLMMRQLLDREGDDYKVIGGDGESDLGDCSAAAGARQIIEGNANIVTVLPVIHNTNDVDKSLLPFQMETALADKANPFPNDVIIVPGSYNPPHHGHVGLANAAVAALRKIRQTEEKEYNEASSSSSNMLRSRYSSLESFSTTSSSSSVLKTIWETIDKDDYDPTVLFEMSVTNADKPPLNPSEVQRRIDFFPTLSDLPQDWGVILTNAPLFSQKTSLLDEVFKDNASSPVSSRKMTFVLGTDTFVRIINPKYYDNSIDNMIDALVEMKDKGVHFIVGGRLEQTESGSNKFINGREEVESLPGHVQEMFTLLTEEEFRLDVSSTEIRRQMEERS